MSADVLPFTLRTTKDQSEIPTPYYYRAGDSYLRLDITDDSGVKVGLYPGATAIIRRDHRADSLLHLFERGGDAYFARITYVDASSARVWSNPYEGETVELAELDIVGAAVEIYPLGMDGPRQIIHQPERARLLAPVHPEQGMEVRLARAQ